MIVRSVTPLQSVGNRHARDVRPESLAQIQAQIARNAHKAHTAVERTIISRSANRAPQVFIQKKLVSRFASSVALAEYPARRGAYSARTVMRESIKTRVAIQAAAFVP